ncbi:hypothetical protein CBS9595_001547 [Malassezia furfur]|nr:hypothetical protein CBS9595_001547 [Malassezia furfur]
MFYDLNIPWPSHGLAVDVPTKKGKKNNQPSSAPVLEEAPDDDPLARLLPAEQQRITTLTYELRSFLDKDNLIKSGTGFVTANSNALLQYDLLSVMPLTDAAFQHACITLSELKPFSVDIITLDLAASPRLPFHLKRSTVGAALANGVVFEITYGDALDPSREARDVPTARRNLFSNARDLLRVTNGKGVIFSSGALAAMSLRAPYDVMNLATLMGMTATSAKDTLSATCRSLMIRAQTRQTFRGAVSRLSVEPADSGGESKSPSDTTHTQEMVRAKDKTKPRKRKRNEQGI